MKLLATLLVLTLASPLAFAQELEEAPGAAPMDTAPPPSNEELNDAVNQLSQEKSPPPERPAAHRGPLKHGTSFPTKRSAPKKPTAKKVPLKKVAKKAAKAAKGKKAPKTKKKH